LAVGLAPPFELSASVAAAAMSEAEEAGGAEEGLDAGSEADVVAFSAGASARARLHGGSSMAQLLLLASAPLRFFFGLTSTGTRGSAEEEEEEEEEEGEVESGAEVVVELADAVEYGSMRSWGESRGTAAVMSCTSIWRLSAL